MRGLFVGSVALLVVAAMGAGAAARSVFGSGGVTGGAGLETAACTPSWRIVASGSEAPSLGAVAVLSARDVWAVGGGKKPVIAHWDGTSLRSHPSSVALSAVAAVSRKDVWAVGPGPVALHWNGTRWKRVALPRVRGGEGDLYGVVAISAGDVWAVGSQGSGDVSSVLPLAMHWDGTRWRVIKAPPFPIGPYGELYDVDAASPGEVWAVGVQTHRRLEPSLAGLLPLVLRWSGNGWKTSAAFSMPPNSSLDAVDVVSAPEAWALANDWANNGDNAVVRWDGRKTTVAFKYSGQGGLWDLAVTRNNVWLVGHRSSPTSLDRPLVVHWDGRSWRVQTTPMDRLKGATLTSVAALSPAEVWAVGNHLVARYAC